MDKITKKDQNKNLIISGILALIIGFIISLYGYLALNPIIGGIGTIIIIIGALIVIPLKALGYISITVGFLGMAFTLLFLVKSSYSLFFVPEAPPGLAPVLPGVSIEGLPKLSFWHWIISILIVAVIHEFCHGIFSRLIKVRIKSTGFAFLGPILAAFVEPDEKQLSKKKTSEQLQVFSVGPFSNIILAIIILLSLIFVFSPIASAMVDIKGVEINSIDENMQISKTRISDKDIIRTINGVKIDDINKIKIVLSDFKPGDKVKVMTDKGEYEVELGKSKDDKPILGVNIAGYDTEVKEKYKFIHPIYLWIGMLLFWLFNISFGVGLFNLLPLGPVDGGRMFYACALFFTKDKSKATKILTFMSLLILLLIFINMWPFIFKLLKFIFSPLLILIK